MLVASVAAGQTPVDRFLAYVKTDSGIEAEASRLIRRTWQECQKCDAAEFLTQGLAVLSPAFREGLDAYDADGYERCALVMGGLRSDANPFLAAHAAVYEVKALVELDRLLDAGRRIEPLIADAADGQGRIAMYSYFASEIAFLRGFCLLADLEYDAAEDALSRFVRNYPDASQRLALAARQMIVELANRQPGKIGEVADLMNYAGRRLTHRCANGDVQTRQQRIIEILDRLIDDAEQQESDSSSSSSSSGGSGKNQTQQPSNPMQQSQLPSGAAAQGSLRDARRANPGDMWGAMPPAERERILQALRESFPSRYRRLVEQYYEQLGKE